MKYSIFLFFSLVFVSPLWSQSAADMDALLNAVGAEKYNYMASHDQERLQQIAYANRHGYYVAPIGQKTDVASLPDALLVTSNYPSATPLSLEMIESGTMNRVLYNFDIPKDGSKYYRIGTIADKVLIIMSQKVINLHKTYLNE